MKIISKFKDYYDAGLSYGIDEKLVLVRKTENIKKKYNDSEYFHADELVHSKKGHFIFKKGNIYFCGKKYPHIKVSTFTEEKSMWSKYALGKEDYFYDKEDFINFLNESEIDKKEVGTKLGTFRGSHESFWDTYFGATDAMSAFEGKKVPYFYKGSYSSWDIVKEGSDRYHTAESYMPVLKTFKFSKAVDPFLAFQEISMFLGALNTEESNPNSNISDKDLLKGKGFDCMSFKKRGIKENKCKSQ